MRRLTPSLLLLLLACGDKDPVDSSPVDDTGEITDADGDGSAASDDCDDNDPAVSPSADELCDGVDNNCDGQVDEDSAVDASTWWLDYDGDGYGGNRVSVQACEAPAEHVADSSDCDDQEPLSWPGADEVCDEQDNDCDGLVDNDPIDALVVYPDTDGDGYGNPGAQVISCDGVPSGHVENALDCNDGDPNTSPDAEETCDGADNDCDGSVDEDDAADASIWYQDSDGDGYGDPNATATACDQPSGYVANSNDCDDGDTSVTQCSCTLATVSAGSTLVRSGSTQGSWMQDPLETLGAGKIWEMDSYTAFTVEEFASQADMISRTVSSTITLPYQAEGTGAQVYDGALYYLQNTTSKVVKFDLATQTVLGELTIPGAGNHNTYPWDWGGYSDIDVAFDEDGMWLIYATAQNNGRIVVSSVDHASLTITGTWNTNSDARSTLGNAWMMCGVMYTTDDYHRSTTVNYAFDTSDGSEWVPNISFPTAHTYNSSVAYNPANGQLYSWDDKYRVLYSTTTSSN